MIALLACAPPPHPGEVVVRVPVDDPADVAWLEAHGDVWSEHVRDHADVRLHRRVLDELPFPYEVLVPDVDAAIERSLGAVGPGFFDDWRPFDEVLDHLDALDAASDLAEVRELGTSREGRPIRGLLVREEEDERPGILITATQHAREWVAAGSALWIADHLVNGAGDPEVDDLLARYKVLVVPVVNPDGYEHTWTTDRLWRKNRRDNGDGSVGVDLNRNWEAGFGGPGSAGGGTSDNYRGPFAFSEPETAAVAAYVEAHPRYAVAIDLHCTGQVVLSPWGFTGAASPDAALLDGGGATAAAAMGDYGSGPMYTRFYPASGIAIDWTYGRHGLNSWLLELRDRGQYGFLLPVDQLVPTAEEAWAGLVSLADEPPARLGLTVEPLVPGGVALVDVWRTTPGARVELYASTTGPGSTLLGDGTELELDAAELLGTDRAGPRARATVEVAVPAAWAGGTVWFQAIDGEGRTVVVSETVP